MKRGLLHFRVEAVGPRIKFATIGFCCSNLAVVLGDPRIRPPHAGDCELRVIE